MNIFPYFPLKTFHVQEEREIECLPDWRSWVNIILENCSHPFHFSTQSFCFIEIHGFQEGGRNREKSNTIKVTLKWTERSETRGPTLLIPSFPFQIVRLSSLQSASRTRFNFRREGVWHITSQIPSSSSSLLFISAPVNFCKTANFYPSCSQRK